VNLKQLSITKFKQENIKMQYDLMSGCWHGNEVLGNAKNFTQKRKGGVACV
jgi:hypothetical protein